MAEQPEKNNSFTVKEILDIANDARDMQGQLEQYYDEDGKFVPPPGDGPIGDSLAMFAVVEIIETFDKDQPRDKQIDEAVRVLERGVEDLQNIIAALQNHEE